MKTTDPQTPEQKIQALKMEIYSLKSDLKWYRMFFEFIIITIFSGLLLHLPEFDIPSRFLFIICAIAALSIVANLQDNDNARGIAHGCLLLSGPAFFIWKLFVD